MEILEGANFQNPIIRFYRTGRLQTLKYTMAGIVAKFEGCLERIASITTKLYRMIFRQFWYFCKSLNLNKCNILSTSEIRKLILTGNLTINFCGFNFFRFFSFFLHFFCLFYFRIFGITINSRIPKFFREQISIGQDIIKNCKIVNKIFYTQNCRKNGWKSARFSIRSGIIF